MRYRYLKKNKKKVFHLQNHLQRHLTKIKHQIESKINIFVYHILYFFLQLHWEHIYSAKDYCKKCQRTHTSIWNHHINAVFDFTSHLTLIQYLILKFGFIKIKNEITKTFSWIYKFHLNHYIPNVLSVHNWQHHQDKEKYIYILSLHLRTTLYCKKLGKVQYCKSVS